MPCRLPSTWQPITYIDIISYVEVPAPPALLIFLTQVSISKDPRYISRFSANNRGTLIPGNEEGVSLPRKNSNL
jgi:hypothetical protein